MKHHVCAGSSVTAMGGCATYNVTLPRALLFEAHLSVCAAMHALLAACHCLQRELAALSLSLDRE